MIWVDGVFLREGEDAAGVIACKGIRLGASVIQFDGGHSRLVERWMVGPTLYFIERDLYKTEDKLNPLMQQLIYNYDYDMYIGPRRAVRCTDLSIGREEKRK